MALILRRRGIHRVRPLAGGIDAWVAAGRPVEALESCEPSKSSEAEA